MRTTDELRGRTKNNRDTSIRPTYSARHKQANQTAGDIGAEKCRGAAPYPCCRAPMRLCRVEGEHHCSDDAKHRKSEGSHETCPG